MPADFRKLIGTRCATYAPGDSSIKDNELGLVIHPDFDRIRGFDQIGLRQLSGVLREAVAEVSAADRAEALAMRGQSAIGATTAATFDPNGRLVLPPMLRKFAGIGDYALFWGNVDFFEIWDPAKARAAFAGDKVKSAILDYLIDEKGLKL